jgi:hypothetical protein
MYWTIMRFAAWPIVVCLVSGCTVCENASRTMKYEPAAFSWKHDRKRSLEIYARWADQAWAEEVARRPDMPPERDYQFGFRDGFVDFVWAGGNGEPPPVPPRQFWNAMLRSPDGKQRADLWFEGYRHGARVARIGGYRELGTVHSSLFGRVPDSNGFDHPTDVSAPSADDSRVPAPDEEILPELPSPQPAAATDTPISTPTAFAAGAETNKLSAMPLTTVQSSWPVGKQPAALEALGLALLPTDQPTETAAAKPTTSDVNQPDANDSKTYTPPRAQLRTPDVRDIIAAEFIEPFTQGPSKSSPTALPVPAPGSHADKQRASQSIREIVLKKTPARGQVITATHLAPVVVREPKYHLNMTGNASEQPDTVSQASAEIVTEAMVDKLLPIAEAAVATVSTESTTLLPTSPKVRQQFNGGMPQQKTGSLMEFVSLPVRETAIEQPSSVHLSPRPQISITECDDQHVERIVIASRPPTNTATAISNQTEPATSSTKVYSSNGASGRAPVQGQVHALRIIAPSPSP